MENLKFCDSCGLPIVEGKLGCGKLEDGSSPNSVFCELCYRNGRLLTAEMSKEQIIEQSFQAYISRFGWKNLKNARKEAELGLVHTSRFGRKTGPGPSWKFKLIAFIIIVAVLVVLKFLFR